MASTEKKDDGCDCCTLVVLALVYLGLFIVPTYLPPLKSLGLGDPDGDKPTSCSVELVAARGLQAALAPGAASPGFDLVVHVDNGRAVYGLAHDGGDVVVSYAGVPLARGRTPALRLAPKEAAALPVTAAASAGAVGVPGDLLRLMAEERRWGVAQVQVEFAVGWESFVCDVDLAGQPYVSACYKLNGDQ
ncbi:hypothetical protein ACP4OV_029632 [Aristida adscensionis]